MQKQCPAKMRFSVEAPDFGQTSVRGSGPFRPAKERKKDLVHRIRRKRYLLSMILQDEEPEA